MSCTGAAGTAPAKCASHVRGAARGQRRVQQFGQHGAVGEPRRERREALVLRPVRPVEPGAQHRPEFLFVAHDEDPAVRGAVELAGGQRRMRRARLAALRVALVEEPARQVVQVGQRGVEQADIDVPALPGRARGEDAAEQRQRGVDARHHVDDRQAEPRRRAVGLAGQRQVARLGLHQIVVARPVRPAAVPPIGREMRADDARIGVLQRGVGHAEPRRLVAAQVVQHAVGAAHQVAQHRPALLRAQAERDRALVAVERLEEMAVVFAEEIRPDLARDVAALGRVFEFDHLGAHVGELH